ncbi:hypothetical protein [Streptomyces sp. NBC_00151]|uniref:hypothetical protein n=1 Tax=Streptomyces sp. NBC_00151 TaxID=2975669 RepID=UPI002DDC4A33|nr:hypothetical protein [Streptomyces sp. NBC_00151]WRZ36654.1 hypothetical protein OG915_00140 [Streptomyces sp. NBC_00151]WRZ44919.1 hypothetical protein OG915_47395 [Streptomyces sp. NBC_00151]
MPPSGWLMISAHGIAYLVVKWDAMTDDVPAPAARPTTAALSDKRTATSSGASWFRIKVMAPILASAAVAATGAFVAPATAATNSAPVRNTMTAMEAGDTT